MRSINKRRLDYLAAMQSEINQLILMHLAYIFLLNPHYLVLEVYIDYLDEGQNPPENAQYWVASFIQQIFDELIRKYRSDIADFIKQQSCMKLD